MKKYLYLLVTYLPPLIFFIIPACKSGWPLISVASVSIIFLGVYLSKNNVRFDLEKNQGKNGLLSFFDFLFTIGGLLVSYEMLILALIELTFKYDLNSKIVFIFCLLIVIPVVKSWRRIIINFIKKT